MKRFKNMTAAKKLTILAIVILSIFASINIFWAASAGFPSYGYKERLGVGAEEDRTSYNVKKDGLVYAVHKSAYMGGRAYLHVYNRYTVDLAAHTDNGIAIDLYIWPDIFGNYKYGVMLTDEIDDINEMIFIDENLNHLPYDPDDTETNVKMEELLDNYRDQIRQRIDGAQSMWKLDENDTLYGIKAYFVHTA